MRISPDEFIIWQYGYLKVNLTIATTWMLMTVLTVTCYIITRKLRVDKHISNWQGVIELIVTTIKSTIEDIGLKQSDRYLSFLGTLFVFIATSNLFTIFPLYESPTSSISTTVALATCVFLAVPMFGISKKGILGYLKSYMEPVFIMLPFNIISELSRTLALAVRLFGNMMSGGLIVIILLSISPIIFPVLLTLLGLLTGMVQAYIFAVLATVYIAAATQSENSKSNFKRKNQNG